MTFQDATDQLMREGVTVAEIAEALGVRPATARAYRLSPEANGYRRPPAEWINHLAALAESRSESLAGLAQELRRAATT